MQALIGFQSPPRAVGQTNVSFLSGGKLDRIKRMPDSETVERRFTSRHVGVTHERGTPTTLVVGAAQLTMIFR